MSAVLEPRMSKGEATRERILEIAEDGRSRQGIWRHVD